MRVRGWSLLVHHSAPSVVVEVPHKKSRAEEGL